MKVVMLAVPGYEMRSVWSTILCRYDDDDDDAKEIHMGLLFEREVLGDKEYDSSENENDGVTVWMRYIL